MARHPRPSSAAHPRRSAAAAVALLIVAALGSCSDDEPAADPPHEPADAPADEAVRDGTYDWRRVPLGGGGFVTGIVTAVDGDDAVLYTRTDVGGAYRWDDDGERWVQLLLTGTVDGDELTSGDYQVASIAVDPSDPDTVVLVVGDDPNPDDGGDVDGTGRVLRSSDGGASWASSDQRWFESGNQAYRTGSERIGIDPSDPDRMLLGTQREGLWSTDDGGRTWEQVPLDVIPDGVDDEPSTDQAGVSLVTYLPRTDDGRSTALVGVAGSGLFVSTGQDGWDRLLALDPGTRPSSATPAGADLLLSIDTFGRPDARLLRVAGERVTDIEPPAGADRWNLAADPHDPRLLVLTDDAVRDGHLWSSDDGGASWRAHDVDIDARRVPWLAQTDLDSYMSAGRLAFDPVVEGQVWFAEGMGVWRATDIDTDVVTWTSEAPGIEQLVVSTVVDPPGEGFFIGAADRQGFHVTSLEGYPARTLVDPGFASGSSIDVSAGDPDRMAWAGAQSNLPPDRASPRGATSVDGGSTWDEMGGLVPAMYGGEVAVSTTDPDRIVWLPTHAQHPYQFRAEPLGLYASGDGGRSWEHVRPDGDVDSFHRFFWWFGRRALAADRADGRFYLMSDEERFYASADGGLTWDQAPYAPPCSEAVACHVLGQVQAVPGEAGQLWASTGAAGLHRTDDAGATGWERVEGLAEAGLFAFGAPIGDADVPAVYVVGRADGEPDGALGIWRSADDGASWDLLSRHPLRLAAGINALGADPEVPGRVYVGFAGLGVVVGDDPTL